MLFNAFLFLQLALYATRIDADSETAEPLDYPYDEESNNDDKSQEKNERFLERLARHNDYDQENEHLNPCPTGFSKRVNAVNKCYAILPRATDWDTAQSRCKRLNPKAHLAFINSPLENQIISELLEGYDCQGAGEQKWFWIGGRRRQDSCSYNFVWKSHPRNEQTIAFYNNWCPSAPYCSSQQYCMAYAKNCHYDKNVNGWQDDVCASSRCSVCEVLRFEQSQPGGSA